MSTVNDLPFIPSINAVQTEQPKGDVVTHQPPPPSYSQINPLTIPAPYQNPTGPVYVYQNGQMIPGPHVPNPMNGPNLRAEITMNIPDHLRWSIFNMLCCLWPLGLVATVISVITKRKKTYGDFRGARCTSTWAGAMNILATLGGIILIILVSLHFNGAINIG
jgi:hypothetical protein